MLHGIGEEGIRRADRSSPAVVDSQLAHVPLQGWVLVQAGGSFGLALLLALAGVALGAAGSPMCLIVLLLLLAAAGLGVKCRGREAGEVVLKEVVGRKAAVEVEGGANLAVDVVGVMRVLLHHEVTMQPLGLHPLALEALWGLHAVLHHSSSNA